MNRRVIGLVVAVVLAAVATGAIYLYATGADDRAEREFDLREVYVATQQIDAGTPAEAAISQALIERREIPNTAVAEGAIGSLEQIQGLVVVAPIVPGQQIVSASFGDSAAAGTTPGARLEIPEGLQAVSVDLEVVPGVAGFVDPGDRISILSVINVDEAQGAAAPAEGEPAPAPGQGIQARYVLQNVQVLALGQRVTTTDENGNATGKAIRESTDTYIFTVALEPSQIEKLVFAETQSTLWATLLPSVPDEEAEQREPVNTSGASADNLFQ